MGRAEGLYNGSPFVFESNKSFLADNIKSINKSDWKSTLNMGVQFSGLSSFIIQTSANNDITLHESTFYHPSLFQGPSSFYCLRNFITPCILSPLVIFASRTGAHPISSTLKTFSYAPSFYRPYSYSIVFRHFIVPRHLTTLCYFCTPRQLIVSRHFTPLLLPFHNSRRPLFDDFHSQG